MGNTLILNSVNLMDNNKKNNTIRKKYTIKSKQVYTSVHNEDDTILNDDLQNNKNNSLSYKMKKKESLTVDTNL